MSTTLKEHRERLGMSQAQVARSAGVTEKTVWSIEQGHSTPRLDTARRFARVLGISVDELLPPEVAA